MDRTTCGWCGAIAYMTRLAQPVQAHDVVDDASVLQYAYTCDNCGRINIATHYHGGDHPEDEGDVHPANQGDLQCFDTEDGPVFGAWTPRPHQQRTYPDVPDHIADAATETTLCASTGAHRAVAALARAVVEATAKDKGITVHRIEAKIDALAAAGHLRPDVTAAAHEIRHFGNDMAHGDFTDPVTADQAADMVDLMDEILQEIYQGPARTARIRGQREARKAAKTARTPNQTTAT